MDLALGPLTLQGLFCLPPLSWKVHGSRGHTHPCSQFPSSWLKHRLCFETQIPSAKAQAHFQGLCRLLSWVRPPKGWPCCSWVCPWARCVPKEWLLAGVYLVNSERQVEKCHLKSLGLEDTLDLEIIFRRTQVFTCSSEKVTLFLNSSQLPSSLKFLTGK